MIDLNGPYALFFFNFLKNKSPKFMSEVFNISHQRSLNTRHSYLKVDQIMRKTNAGQNALSFRGPGEWNKLPNELKKFKRSTHLNIN